MAATPLKRLQDRAAAIVQDMKAVSQKAEDEGRKALTEDEEKEFSALSAEADDVEKAIDRETRLMEREKKLAVVVQTGDSNPIDTAKDEAAKIAKGKQLAKACNAQGVSSYVLSPKFQRVRDQLGITTPEMNERLYKSGKWMLASMARTAGQFELANRCDQWCRENGVGQTMLAEGPNINQTGGVFVPEVLSDSIIILREMYGVYRRFAKRWPMSSDTLIIPRRTGGLTTYFVSDNVSTTASTMAWDGVQLIAKELACLTIYPLTLAEDAVISIADTLTDEIAYQFGLTEDNCGFIGNGTSTYGGMRGITVLITDANHGNSTTTNGTVAGGLQIAKAGGTTVGSTVLGDYENLVGLLPQYASANACWFMHRSVYAAGPQRLMDAGGGNTNETLSAGGLGSLTSQDPWGRPYRTFLGFPVIIVQAMPTNANVTASTVFCALGDLSLSSAMGDRKEVSFSTSKDRYFEFRQLAIQGLERFDINNHDLGNTTTAGPLVCLQTSAS